MKYSIGIILGTIFILCVLAYITHQRIKRVRKIRIDIHTESTFIDEVPYRVLSSFDGKRCLYADKKVKSEK